MTTRRVVEGKRVPQSDVREQYLIPYTEREVEPNRVILT